MNLTKERVLSTVKYIENNPEFDFPFKILCLDFSKEHERYQEDCLDFKYDKIKNDKSMIHFMLVEDLQSLCLETVELMSKGFFEKIEQTNALREISNLAEECRDGWKRELCESEDINEYGLNEFFGGKADAYEDCARIIKQKSSRC